jgi:hypothetical protein
MPANVASVPAGSISMFFVQVDRLAGAIFTSRIAAPAGVVGAGLVAATHHHSGALIQVSGRSELDM